MANVNCALVYQQVSYDGFAELSVGDRRDLTQGVYDEALLAGSHEEVIEAIWHAGNVGKLPRLRYSLSVGDIVALVAEGTGEATYYECANLGWHRVKCSEHYDQAHQAYILVRAKGG